MKLTKHFFALLFIFPLFFTSCSDENLENIKTNEVPGRDKSNLRIDLCEQAQQMDEDYGNWHNDGLTYVIDKYNDEKASLGQDTAAILNFIQSTAEEYNLSHPIYYNNEPYYSNIRSFTDNEMLSFASSDFSNDNSSYLNDLTISYFENLTYEECIDEITNRQNLVCENVSEENERIRVLLSLSILKKSMMYWYTVPYPASSGKWVAIGLADAIGAGRGALWGCAVAGPAGGIAMGVNGALIGSCTSFIIGSL